MYSIRSTSSGLLALGKGRPIITTQRARSSWKLMPSESLALTTAKRIAPLGESGWVSRRTYTGRRNRRRVALQDALNVLGMRRLLKDALSLADTLEDARLFPVGKRAVEAAVGRKEDDHAVGNNVAVVAERVAELVEQRRILPRPVRKLEREAFGARVYDRAEDILFRHNVPARVLHEALGGDLAKELALELGDGLHRASGQHDAARSIEQRLERIGRIQQDILEVHTHRLAIAPCVHENFSVARTVAERQEKALDEMHRMDLAVPRRRLAGVLAQPELICIAANLGKPVHLP